MASEQHLTRIEHDGTCFYWWCSAGDVSHTANAFDGLLEAVEAADEHRETVPLSA